METILAYNSGINYFFGTEANLVQLMATGIRWALVAEVLLIAFILGVYPFKVGKELFKGGPIVDINWLFVNVIGKSLLLWLYIPLMGGVIGIFAAIEVATQPDYDHMEKVARTMSYVNNTGSSVRHEFDANGDLVIFLNQDENSLPEQWAQNALKDVEGNTTGNMMVDSKTLPGKTEQKLPEFSIMQLLDASIIQNIIKTAFAASSGLINSVSMVVIKGIIAAMVSVLYLLGLLAIPFSVLPFFEDKLGTWFSRFCGVLGTYVTFNAVDFVTYSVFVEGVFSRTGEGVADASLIGAWALNISTIILNVLVFWLTSTWVGSAEGGKVLSTAATIGTAAGNKIMKMFGGKGFNAGGGVAADIASSSRKTFEE